MDAISLLEKEHVTVKRLLKQLDEAEKAPERQRLYDEVRENLKAHEIIEEEIFYPALRAHPKAKELVLESLVEHDVVDHLMGELDTMKASDEFFAPRAQVMRENVEHHIEEEETELFKKARQVFDKGELEDLGARMTRRRAELDRDGLGAEAKGASKSGGAGKSSAVAPAKSSRAQSGGTKSSRAKSGGTKSDRATSGGTKSRPTS